MPRRKEKKTRPVTTEESFAIISSAIFEKERDFIKIDSHIAFPHKGFDENVYRCTMNILSLDMLIRIMEHEQVENVYFNPSAPGPGAGMDGISMVYRIFIRYRPVVI